MNTNRRNHRADSDETAQNILVFGRKNFGLTVAEYLTEDANSVTFVSEDHPTDVADGVNFIQVNRSFGAEFGHPNTSIVGR